MPTEELTYAQIAERLSVSTEAARAIVKRHRLPRSRSNDGKTLAAIDLEEIRYKPMPARSSRRHQPVIDVVATLKARVAELEAELAQAEEGSRGHRADFERERQRSDRLVKLSARYWKPRSRLTSRSPPGHGARCLGPRDGAGCGRPGEIMTALRRLLTANWPRQAGGGHFLWGPVTCNGRGVVTHNGGSKTRAKNARFDAVSGTLAGEKPRGSGGGY
jgi:hypothetical protein